MTQHPVSIKGVVLIGNRVLLARNSRDEWELLGGQPETDEDPLETVRREVREESGLRVEVVRTPITEYDFAVLGADGPMVRVVVYGCQPLPPEAEHSASDEHLELKLFNYEEMSEMSDFPDGYRSATMEWMARLAAN